LSLITVQVTIVIVLVMGCVGVLSTYQQKEKFTSILDTRAEWLSRQLALTLVSPLWNFDEGQIDGLLNTYLSDSDVLAVKLTEADSETPLRHLGKSDVSEVIDLGDQSTVSSDQDAFSLVAEIVHEEEVLGHIEVTFSRAFVTSQMHETIMVGGLSLILQVSMVTLILIVLVRRRISAPLAAKVSAATQIAEGDVSMQLAQVHSKDEIGDLSAAFQDMIGYLHDMATKATQISQGDLRHEVVSRSQKDALGEAFLNMTQYLRTMAAAATDIAGGDLRREIVPNSEHDALGLAFQQMASLRQIVSQVMDGSSQLESASNTLEQMSVDMTGDAQRASMQIHDSTASGQRVTEDVTHIAFAMAEDATTIQDISLNTRKIADIATDATRIVNSATEVIGTLAMRSEEIGQLVDLITGVARKSHLLALNATIEAQRAGEGNRFAIVAAEVKELAQITAQSAKDIASRAEAIQSSSDESSEAINQLSSIVQQIGELTATNANAVERHNATQQEISERTTSLAGSSKDITQTMKAVADGSDQIHERATSVQESARQLNLLAEKLRQAVAQFRV
jgi:methyl-accepting chemotaxis protein